VTRAGDAKRQHQWGDASGEIPSVINQQVTRRRRRRAVHAPPTHQPSGQKTTPARSSDRTGVPWQERRPVSMDGGRLSEEGTSGGELQSAGVCQADDASLMPVEDQVSEIHEHDPRDDIQTPDSGGLAMRVSSEPYTAVCRPACFIPASSVMNPRPEVHRTLTSEQTTVSPGDTPKPLVRLTIGSQPT
jgi:hypothetical protein